MSTDGADLLFQQLATSSADLVFGEFAGAVALISGTISLDDSPMLQASAIRVARVTAVMPLADDIEFAGTGEYQSQTQRPLVATVRASWGIADPTPAGIEARYSDSQRMHAIVAAKHTQADKLHPSVASGWRNSARTRAGTTDAWRNAERVQADQRRALWQDATRTRAGGTHAWRNAQPVHAKRTTDWQERYRDRRPTIDARWTEAKRSGRPVVGRTAQGKPLEVGRVVPWGEAMRPPAGMWVPPTPPGPDPCYVADPHLVFGPLWDGSKHLVFICERHPDTPPLPPATVVVPVRRVYMTLNQISLVRVAGDIALTPLSIRISIDADSWTYSFSATLPGYEESTVDAGDGDPFELEATINGNTYRVLAEEISRDRGFGKSRITVSGRGRNAQLADVVRSAATVMTFSNAAGDRNASQLVDDALLDNGVPIGWSVDWGLEDWLVPAGAWVHQGTRISAAKAIAEAAGGYLQPHRTDQALRIMHRYPTLPWDWAGATPDFELPSAITTREGIRWHNKPAYNRVFVAGQVAGRLGQITRAGTAGDFAAPMVVDALVTAAEASRQRGMTILADTGRQAELSLRLPVLSETGVIDPGALVRYLDGATTRVGLVRSSTVEANAPSEPGAPVIVRQTLGVETHVLP